MKSMGMPHYAAAQMAAAQVAAANANAAANPESQAGEVDFSVDDMMSLVVDQAHNNKSDTLSTTSSSEDYAQMSSNYRPSLEDIPSVAVTAVNPFLSGVLANDPAGQRKRASPSARWHLKEHQRRALEAFYQQVQRPSRAASQALASKMGVSLKQIKVWFRNRRQRDRLGTSPGTEAPSAPQLGSIQPSGTAMPWEIWEEAALAAAAAANVEP